MIKKIIYFNLNLINKYLDTIFFNNYKYHYKNNT